MCVLKMDYPNVLFPHVEVIKEVRVSQSRKNI